jgi:hypothetical protein
MVRHELDQTDGILTLAPEGPLAAEDFAGLTAEVDPYLILIAQAGCAA